MKLGANRSDRPPPGFERAVPRVGVRPIATQRAGQRTKGDDTRQEDWMAAVEAAVAREEKSKQKAANK